MRCPRCGSEKIAGPLKTNTLARMGFFGPFATFEAYICLSCGNAMLMADKAGLDNVRRSHGFNQQDVDATDVVRRCPACAAEVAYGDMRCRECGSSLEDV